MTLVGPRHGLLAFSGAAFAISTLHFARLHVQTAAKGAVLAAGALVLRLLDKLDSFEDGVEVAPGPGPGVRIHVGATLSAVGLSITSLWLLAKTKGAFFWYFCCAAISAAPSVLEVVLNSKREAPALRQWVTLELQELPTTLHAKRPDVLASCQDAFVHQWSCRGLGEEATVKDLIDLVRTTGTKVVVSSLINCVLPGTADHLTGPATSFIEPHTTSAVNRVAQNLNGETIVAALAAANIEVHGSGEDAMALRVRKADCLRVIDTQLVGPAFDAALVQLEEVLQDGAALERTLQPYLGSEDSSMAVVALSQFRAMLL